MEASGLLPCLPSPKSGAACARANFNETNAKSMLGN